MSSISPEGHFLETLEARVTPAVYLTDVPNGDPTIVDPSTVTYRDADGDMVTVKFSKGIIDSQETLNAIFDFSEAVDTGYGIKGYELKGISLADFTGDAKLLRNLDISVSAEVATLSGVDSASVLTDSGHYVGYNDWVTMNFGDGHANVGYINAAGTDLGNVSIDGNLEKITAGDNKVSNGGLRSLTVESLGALGDAGEALASDYTSVVNGALKNLEVAGNVSGALLKIQGGKYGDLLNAHIRGDILGGASADAGAIKAEGTIKAFVLNGSLVGADAANTGLIYASDDIKSLTIRGDLQGGSGVLSGSVAAGDKISKISIEGDLVGGMGTKSGSVASFEAKIGKVDHGGDATAGPGSDSGKFLSFINKPIKAEKAHGAYGAAGAGFISFNGGTLQAANNNVDFIRDFEDGSYAGGTLTLSGLVLNTNGYDILLSDSLSTGLWTTSEGTIEISSYTPVDLSSFALNFLFVSLDEASLLSLKANASGIWGAI